MRKILITLVLCSLVPSAFSQNVGIGINTPSAKLHIKGSADTSQLVIDAFTSQSNSRPLFKLRKSNGTDLLWIHSDTSVNIFIGLNAGRANIASASGNGSWNTFIGSNAGASNTNGFSNTALGYIALNANTTGFGNTALGYRALMSATTASFNTACGHLALMVNTTGTQNTACGIAALESNTTGQENTAIGSEALAANTNGFQNSAMGVSALHSNSTGVDNTANGYEALYSNTTGNSNAATGLSALFLNSTGSSNTANGFYSLFSNSTGSNNTGYGAYTLYATTASQFNTAIGFNAGGLHNLGWNNTLIGANADVNAEDIYNAIAVGKDALCTAVNQTRIATNATTSIGGYVNWSNISDGRIKRNIQENVPGLSFINKLKPVTYNLDLDAADRIIQTLPKKDLKGNVIVAAQFETDARKQKEQIVYSGFIAQDVEKTAKELGYDFSGVDAAKNDKDLYGLRYAEFVVPLVKAVQELSKKNDDMKSEIELLKEQNKMLLQLVNKKN